MRKGFPMAKSNVREGKKVATNQVEYGPPKKNKFYDLQSILGSGYGCFP